MANGQQKGEVNVAKLEAWLATQSDESFKQLEYRGKLNRREIAKGCGFGESAIKQNPQIKIRLKEIETDLQDRGILPPLTPQSVKAQAEPKKYDQDATGRRIDTQRLSLLERQNLNLKAEIDALKTENAQLKRRLERFTEHSEVLSEWGYLPR